MSFSPSYFRYIFLGIYSLESIIKVIAKGFILNNYTYLRNPWNWLDFTVILSGYLTSFIEMGNLAGLRTFRVLRALKTVAILPSKSSIYLKEPLPFLEPEGFISKDILPQDASTFVQFHLEKSHDYEPLTTVSRNLPLLKLVWGWPPDPRGPGPLSFEKIQESDPRYRPKVQTLDTPRYLRGTVGQSCMQFCLIAKNFMLGF